MPITDKDAEIERLRVALGKLRRSHLEVDEDCWYSCPKSGHCCDELAPKDFCNCGADEHNAIIEAALAPEQEADGK